MPAPASGTTGVQQLAVFDRFLQNQTKELELKAGELEIAKKQAEQGHDYSCRALAAQATDRREEREHKRLVSRDRYIFAAVVVIMLAALVTYALHLGKDEFVKEMAKAIGTFVAGALSGAGVLSMRNRQQKREGSSSSDSRADED